MQPPKGPSRGRAEGPARHQPAAFARPYVRIGPPLPTIVGYHATRAAPRRRPKVCMQSRGPLRRNFCRVRGAGRSRGRQTALPGVATRGWSTRAPLCGRIVHRQHECINRPRSTRPNARLRAAAGVDVLIEHKASLARLDAEGKGAADWACQRGHIEVVERLAAAAEAAANQGERSTRCRLRPSWARQSIRCGLKSDPNSPILRAPSRCRTWGTRMRRCAFRQPPASLRRLLWRCRPPNWERTSTGCCA